MAKALIGAGCFWGVEEYFRKLKGVKKTSVGYSGGNLDNPTYKDLIDEGFEVKAYDTSALKTESGLILMFFVTVLQKNKEVYECQEYQTVDENLQTLDLSFICRKITQPYKIGIDT